MTHIVYSEGFFAIGTTINMHLDLGLPVVTQANLQKCLLNNSH